MSCRDSAPRPFSGHRLKTARVPLSLVEASGTRTADAAVPCPRTGSSFRSRVCHARISGTARAPGYFFFFGFGLFRGLDLGFDFGADFALAAFAAFVGDRKSVVVGKECRGGRV